MGEHPVATVREILLNVGSDEVRAVVLEDGQLAEVLLERPQQMRSVGNIYLGRVEDVLPGMDAAFVNIGLDRNAFLYADDAVHCCQSQERTGEGRPRIEEMVRPGQQILVQVDKEPVGSKGAKISTAIGLPGRFVVLTPQTDFLGVSRRIEDEDERARLRALVEESRRPGHGVIVRTVAEGQGAAAIRADLRFLEALWESIQEQAGRAQPPALLHRDMGLSGRLLRDFMTDDVQVLLVDNADEYQNLIELAGLMSPDLAQRIELTGGDLFGKRGLDQEMERAMRRRVWLHSGGYLVIDRAEALTAVDVNTGKFVGKENLAQTILQTNLEAADEIARQLRLRDLGGIIVVDFIDMEEEAHRQQVLDALEQAVKRDRTKVHVLGMTKLNLVEMTRKRVGSGLDQTLYSPCPLCDGWGRVESDETVAVRLRRELRQLLAETAEEAVLVEAHPAVAALLIGPGGVALKTLEQETVHTVFVRGSLDLARAEHRVVAKGARAVVEALARPVVVGQEVEVEISAAHTTQAADGIARIQGYVVDVEQGAGLVGQRVKVKIVSTHRTYARAKLVLSAEASPRPL